MKNQLETSIPDIFPTHLQDYPSLLQHVDSLLEGLPPGEKGDKFARFVIRLLPQSKLGALFGTPELRPTKTHDKGIDLTAKGKDGKSVLYIQAKKRITSTEDVRSVLDGFNEFTNDNFSEAEGGQYKFALDEHITPNYLLITLSRVSGILQAYESRPSTTRKLYQELKDEGRLHIIDGDMILELLRAAFRRFSELPYKLVLNLESEISQKDNVYIGILSSEELKRLYQEFNEALFFENVRDFLGVEISKQRGRTTPNQDIVKTLTESPEKMLERNNGIVMKASDVTFGDSTKQLF